MELLNLQLDVRSVFQAMRSGLFAALSFKRTEQDNGGAVASSANLSELDMAALEAVVAEVEVHCLS